MTSRLPATMRMLSWCLIALTVAGCSSWQATTFPPSAAPTEASRSQATATPRETKFPGVVRFRLVDGTSIEIENAAVDGDSLRGRIPVSISDPSHRLVIYALKDVASVETYRHDGGRTAGVLVVIGLVILGALAAIASSLDDSY